jgi:signal transduction histidine kinase
LWASGRVLSPLTDISTVAQALAKGQFAARVETIDDPDLMPIIRSFNDMAATMEQRIAKDARFASDVSHELRSPLMTLRASIEVMQSRRIELSERASQALDLLADDVNRFEKLVQDLLDLARSNSGSIPSDLVNMTELVEATVAMFEKQPPISILDGANNALVIGDKRRLAQVFDNLLRNAEKYANGATLMRGPGYLLRSENLFFKPLPAETQQKTEVRAAAQALGLLSSMSTLGDTEAQRK